MSNPKPPTRRRAIQIARLLRVVHLATIMPIITNDKPGTSDAKRTIAFTPSLLIMIIIVTISGIIVTTVQDNHIFTVQSGSMEPRIKTGSIILVEKQARDRYNPNDIITFNHQGNKITHRIIEVIPTTSTLLYRTKGDANSTADPTLVYPQQIIGKTTTALPLLGYILSWLKTRGGFALTILFPATVIILHELYAIKKAWDQFSYPQSRHPHTLSVVILLTIATLPTITAASFSATTTMRPIKIATARTFTSPLPIPSPTLPPTANGCEVVVTSDFINKNTGPDSDNKNRLDVTQTCTNHQKNTTTITNKIDVGIQTGSNEVKDSTQAGHITSGNVTISTTFNSDE